jgi:predicted Rossmann fold nucleotide-binding protein DprA/Smf involved in DNA uptake
MAPDALATALEADAGAVMRAVARLETDGRIARYPDGRYGPCEPR